MESSSKANISKSQKAWDPAIYNQFSSQREEPFWDLASLVEPIENAKVVDLGCGDGRLTAELHSRLHAKSTIGIDFAPAMLASTAAHTSDAISFENSDIATWESPSTFDILFSNASLQWVDNHESVLANWKASLTDGGQLAVQVPNNADHPAYLMASEMGEEWLGSEAPKDTVAKNVLKPEEYSNILESLGFERQHVRLVVYPHYLPTTSDVVEWIKGTSLNRFKAVMPAEDYARFIEEYRERLLSELGEKSPYFFTFKRILMWARLPH